MTRKVLRLSTAAAIIATAATATAASAQDTGGPPPLQVVLTQVSPQIPVDGDTLQIDAYVQNNGDDPLDEVMIDLHVTATRIATRSEVEDFTDDSNRATDDVEGATAEVGTVAPGEVAPFRLQAPVSAFELDLAGVYGLEIVATSDREDGTVRTFLTWMPDADEISPIQIAWLWPLVDRPVRDESGAFTNDNLARSLAVGGRLDDLVTAAGGRPVTWVVDPDLLDAAAAMADGYRVAGGDEGTGGETAAQWLDQLRQSVGEHEVLALPYADVDTAGLVHADRIGELDRAVSEGIDATEGHLGRAPVSSIAWPSAGYADTATLSALVGAGYGGVILDDASLPLAEVPIYTPTGRANLRVGSDTISGLLSDSTIGEILGADSTEPGTGPLIVQRVIAETAVIALEQPNRQRAILVEPPRRWSPDPIVAAQLLTAYGEAPWIQPIKATDLLATEEPANIARRAPVFPEEARQAELPAAYLGDVAALGTRVGQFATVLRGDNGLVGSYSSALLRAESGVWADGEGGVREEGVQYLRSLQTDLENQIKQIRIISRGTVTLSSNSGTIPVTIANDLDQPVQVQLALTPRVGSRLSINDVQPFIVEARARQTVEVQASAVANGITTVEARLLTLGGDPLGGPTQFNVRATNFGRVGFWIIGGAMVLLFVSAGVRVARRITGGKRRRPAHAEPPIERINV